MRLPEAQKRALRAYRSGAELTAAGAAATLGIVWPASGSFGKVVRELMLKDLLAFNSKTAKYHISGRGRAALEADHAD